MDNAEIYLFKFSNHASAPLVAKPCKDNYVMHSSLLLFEFIF